MLKKKLPILGLAVSGMRLGPPGMEGTKSLPFNVYKFDNHGEVKLYKKY
jgi:hypothetical protein